MEQEIRSVDVDGRRVAYASVRRGAAARRRAALGLSPRGGVGRSSSARVLSRAGADTPVVRFDRIGWGLSSRELGPRPSSRGREPPARGGDPGGRGGPAFVFASSCCGFAASRACAARAPELVSGIVYFGSLCIAQRHPEATRASIDRVHAGELAARSTDVRRALRPACERRRHPALHAAAAKRPRPPRRRPRFSSSTCTPDLRDVLPQRADPRARPSPARRPDRADRPRARARGAAAERALRAAVAATRTCRGATTTARCCARSPASSTTRRDARRRLAAKGRETEMLRLVATGMSNREIAGDARAQRAHRAPARREHPAQARRHRHGRAPRPTLSAQASCSPLGWCT